MGTFWVPDHALELVFRFLEVEDLVLGARNVCRQWRDVVDQLPFWTRYQHCINLFEIHTRSFDILQNMPSLRSLKSEELTMPFMKALTQSCPNLREIEIETLFDPHEICEGYPIDFKCKLKLESFKSNVMFDSLLKAIAQCPNLTRLSLILRTGHFEIEQVRYLLTKIGQQLVSLGLNIGDHEGRSTLPIVKQYCTSIQHLGFYRILEELKPRKRAAEYSSSHLRSLTLAGRRGHFICPDDILAHFVVPNLVYLRLFCCRGLSKDTLTYIFDSCKQLTKLKLLGCVSLSDEFFESIHLCENLKRLDITLSEHLTEQVLEFIRSCPKLEFLRFCSLCKLSSKGLDAISGMRNLQDIHLTMSGYPDNARETLTRNLPMLKESRVFLLGRENLRLLYRR